MADLIDRSALLKCLSKNSITGKITFADGKSIIETVEDFPSVDADYLIANGVTLQRWIPVSERLPEKDGKCFVWIKFMNWKRVHELADVLFYSAELKAWVLDGCKVNEVTHWMPLNPPK